MISPPRGCTITGHRAQILLQLVLAVEKAPTERFSDRVADYIKYRPHYPQEVLPYLEETISLQRSMEVADIGSGPGHSARLFVEYGMSYVYGVEPNQAMYYALIEQLGKYDNFSAVLASAENTELDSHSLELVVCAQSFHWFDVKKTKSEFSRILKPGGWVVLLWNTRRRDTPFGATYEQLLRQYATDYKEVNHLDNITTDSFDYMFGEGKWIMHTLPNIISYTKESLLGRLRSSSYTPRPTDETYQPLMDAVEQLFDEHQQQGVLSFEYTTEVICGRLL